LAVGYRPSHPLPRDEWAHALALAARRDLSSFALGLNLSAAFPLSITGDGVRLSLQRTELRLEGLKQWELGTRVRLGLGLAASVVFDRRSTEQAGEDRAATPAAMIPSGGFGALVELQCLFSRHVGGLVAGGADGVPWRTRFVVDDGDAQSQIGRLFWLNPWLMVGLFTRFGG
ncbi:MAG TPA: hypothetical protein VFZ61_04910, partial [Polyangiales bacterium]